jgi:hypothetical protein
VVEPPVEKGSDAERKRGKGALRLFIGERKGG